MAPELYGGGVKGLCIGVGPVAGGPSGLGRPKQPGIVALPVPAPLVGVGKEGREGTGKGPGAGTWAGTAVGSGTWAAADAEGGT